MRISTIVACLVAAVTAQDDFSPNVYPPNGAENINPDVQLRLVFGSPPKIGTTGKITILDAATKQVVDTLDLSIPVSPAPDGRAAKTGATTDAETAAKYQQIRLGTYDFHYFPVIIRDNAALVTFHNGVLKYGKKYIVQMDAVTLQGVNFKGFASDGSWTFSTKAAGPAPDARSVVVSADGKGDFNTLQGAIDFMPAKSATRRYIFINNGDYRELVFVNGKSNITIRGQSREGVTVGYPNNSAFNPSRAGPSRRPAFTLSNCDDVQLSSFTIKNYFIGQAEALLVRGDRVIIDKMTLNGSGDAFTTYGTIYFVDSLLTGDGDTVLGYAAVYYLRSEIRSIGPFTWTRTPQGSHGNIFINSTLTAIDEPLPWSGEKVKSVFARLPRNSSKSKNGSMDNFPYAEMILINTKTSGVSPEGWGPVEDAATFDRSNVKFWEYNTMDATGKPVDLSRRDPIVKKLTMATDAKAIADYSDPKFVLKGWSPVVDGGNVM